MDELVNFFDGIFAAFDGVSFGLVALVDLAAFGGVCALSLICSLASARLRSADKRPFLHLVNAFAALTFALFCINYDLTHSAMVAAALWLVGYLVYGALCALTVKRAGKPLPAPVRVSEERKFVPEYAPPKAPPAQSTVRLEHAMSIADKLLSKNLGRGDRQELEKIKTALTLLKVRGTLTADDGEALNEMFNALLKLMAKYDL